MCVKISVIVPVYNVEPYIKQCLDSVVNQTYRNLEIIIIDDGSPDNCGMICDEYAKKDDRIIVIHKENEGLCAARNDGIKKATGDWIAFVDSDDWCELDYYENLVSALKSSSCPDILLAGGYTKNYPHKKRIINTFDKEFATTDREEIESIMVNLPKFGLPWDKLYKTDFLKKTKMLFDTSLNAFEDYWFNFQLYNQAKNVVGCLASGYHYRQVPISISKGYNPNKLEINYRYLSKLYNYISNNGLEKKSMQAVEISSIIAIVVLLNCYYFHPDNPKSYQEIAEEIKAMKKRTIFYEAIWSGDNRYLTKKQIILKYFLRLPCVWPLKLLHAINKCTN